MAAELPYESFDAEFVMVLVVPQQAGLVADDAETVPLVEADGGGLLPVDGQSGSEDPGSRELTQQCGEQSTSSSAATLVLIDEHAPDRGVAAITVVFRLERPEHAEEVAES